MIRIGTDCSGIEAPIQALIKLNIPFKHIWSCENDKYARESIKANYKPETVYEDILTRNHNKLDDIDLYVCGFPCQCYSQIGKRLGENDTRSSIMLECIKTILVKNPSYFILENVPQFKTINEGRLFNYLIKKLEKKYKIYNYILNTLDFGLPQNRKRLYIIGTKSLMSPNVLDIKRKKGINLYSIIDKSNKGNIKLSQSLKKNLEKVSLSAKATSSSIDIITPFTFMSATIGYSPTLTTNCGSFYLPKLNRNLTTKECLLLQGFPKSFKQVVSDAQMYKQAGNSMSVNVIAAIIASLPHYFHA